MSESDQNQGNRHGGITGGTFNVSGGNLAGGDVNNNAQPTSASPVDQGTQHGGISGGQFDIKGGSVAAGDVNNSGPGAGSTVQSGTQNNVTGTQNNVRGNQYNADRDQFIGNRNVSTGSGGIEDYGGVQGGVHNYGGVQGGVNSGSGSQTNTRTGDISNNQGNVAVGSGINQSYSSGSSVSDPKVSALLDALEDLRDNRLDDLTGDDRKSVRGPLTEAIKSLRSGRLDINSVSTTIQQASIALGDADRVTERKALKDAAAAAGLNIR